MRNLILTMLAVIFSLSVFSQEKYKTFKNDYFGKEFDVRIVQNKSQDISLWIDMHSLDKTSKLVTLIVMEKQFDDFKKNLTKAKKKFLEWKKVAEDNKVDKITKQVDIKSKSYNVAFRYGSWHFDLGVKLAYMFTILDDKPIMMMSNGAKLVSSKNKYITSQGFALIFDSAKSFDDFIKLFNANEVNEFFKKKKKKEDLFKN